MKNNLRGWTTSKIQNTFFIQKFSKLRLMTILIKNWIFLSLNELYGEKDQKVAMNQLSTIHNHKHNRFPSNISETRSIHSNFHQHYINIHIFPITRLLNSFIWIFSLFDLRSCHKNHSRENCCFPSHDHWLIYNSMWYISII